MPEGPLTTDFRRGSVGAPPNRENNAARDFCDGFYFRRARFGVEGTIARDFNYRLLLELGGSGTEGPTRINDAWIAYTGLAPFTFQLGAFSPPANMDDGTSPEDLAFLERASASELSRALGGADGRIGLGTASASGKRWMSALTFTTRTVNDAEVFDTPARGGGRVRVASSPPATTTTCTSALRAPMCSRRPTWAPPRRRRATRCASATARKSASTACGSSTPAPSTPRTPVCSASEFGANWKNFYRAGRALLVRRRAARDRARSPIRLSRGYYLQGSWLLTGESRRYNPVTGSFQNPRPNACRSRATAASARWNSPPATAT